eukprot:CAMPEP_0176202876 /NCGR_PEP_ID=MMETSP0121_2-20121125/10295_1 /TAXON_ID=160619 /ORGANISM="Kryptoperidinium foliaceum, Strain CCMP 1326" /LENGTH=754 /DNA_ID=CAMNT_0017541773 /DNA_START=1 /DNA_END=2267 /DNA_ORIENTATION=+
MGLIIVFNFALIAVEADQTAKCFPEWAADIARCPHQVSEDSFLGYTNTSLLILYTIEVLAHAFVWQRQFFCNKWRLLDFFVVVSGWFSFLGTGVNMAFLRMLRIIRVGRFFRVFLSIRELYMLLAGLVSSFKAILFGSILLGLILIIWAIITVEFVHPVNASLTYDGCPRCNQAFQSVGDSMLTLFQQIIAGDSWGMVSVPVIVEQPLTAFILIAIFLSISLATMNLILAVIVEAAAEARERDTEQKLKTRQQECINMKMDLLRICQEMDKDFSGFITMNEMLTAWQDNPDFRRVVAHLDMSKADLGNIFLLMDTSGTGEVKYKDFVDKLYDLRSTEMRLMLTLIGLSQLDHKVSVVTSNLRTHQDFGNAVLRHQSCMIEAIMTKLELPIPELFEDAVGVGNCDTVRSEWHWNSRAPTDAPAIKSAIKECEKRNSDVAEHRPLADALTQVRWQMQASPADSNHSLQEVATGAPARDPEERRGTGTDDVEASLADADEVLGEQAPIAGSGELEAPRAKDSAGVEASPAGADAALEATAPRARSRSPEKGPRAKDAADSQASPMTSGEILVGRSRGGSSCGRDDRSAMDISDVEPFGLPLPRMRSCSADSCGTLEVIAEAMDLAGIAESVEDFIARNTAILRRAEEHMNEMRQHAHGLAAEEQRLGGSEEDSSEIQEPAKCRLSQLVTEAALCVEDHSKALTTSGRLLETWAATSQGPAGEPTALAALPPPGAASERALLGGARARAGAVAADKRP